MSTFIGKRAMRFLSVALSLSVIVWSLGLFALTASVASAATLNEGDIIRGPDGVKVYIINNKGYKRHIFNPEVFNMYGHLKWSNIKSVDQATLDSYKTSDIYRADIDSKVYQTANDGIKRWFNMTGEQFVASGYTFDQVFLVNAKERDFYATGTEITYTGPQQTPQVGGKVAVSLASNNPMSGTLVAGQANANLANFTISNNTSSTVTVTGVKLQRIGVSADTTLAAVYLFDGATRLTDSASVSSGYVNFINSSGIVTLAAGASKTIKVVSNIATGSTGQTVGVKVDSITTSPVATVEGTPAGNTHTIATATLASASFTSASILPSTGTTDPANDVRVFEENVVVSTNAVNFTRISFREVGSIAATDLNNYRLYVDGVMTGSAVASLDANKYVTFDLSSMPKKLETGTHTIKLLADVVGGSSLTYSFSIRYTSDVNFVDTVYNVETLALVNSSTFSSQSTGTITINPGTVSLAKRTDSPSGTIVKGANDVVLGTWDIKAAGEDVKVDTLRAAYDESLNTVSRLRNGRLMLDGVQIGSTADLYEKDGVTTYTEYIVNTTLTAGKTYKLELRADIVDNDGTDNMANAQTLTAQITAGASNNAQGKVSATLLTVPSTAVTANQMTVGTGSLTLAKYSAYTDQSATVPRTAYKLGSWVLSGNSTEDVNLTGFSIDFTSVTSTTFSSADLTNVYMKYGSNTTSTKATVSATGNSYSLSYTLAKNATMNIEVYTDVGSAITSTHSIKSTLTVTGTTAISGASANTSATDGQTIAAATGSIVSAVDASTSPAKNVVRNTTSDVASFKFTTSNDSYTITDIAVALDAATATAAAAVSTIVLKDGSTQLGTASIVYNNSNYHSDLASTYAAVFTGLNVQVPANGYKVLTAALQIGNIGVNYASTGMNVTAELALFKATNSQGVQAVDTTDRTGNAIYAYASMPTITNVSLPSTNLAAGTATLAKIQISSDSAGQIDWKKIIFTATKTTNPTISSVTLWDADSNSQIVGTPTVAGALGAGGVATGTIEFVATNIQSVSGTKTYILKATIGGSIVSGDSVNTNIAQPTTAAAPAAYATVAATSASLVWSDQSASLHDATTLDWMNDYLIKNLPTDSQTLKVN